MSTAVKNPRVPYEYGTDSKMSAFFSCVVILTNFNTYLNYIVNKLIK